MARCKHQHYRLQSGVTFEACGEEGCDRDAHKEYVHKLAICLACGAQGRYEAAWSDGSEHVEGWKPADTYRLVAS